MYSFRRLALLLALASAVLPAIRSQSSQSSDSSTPAPAAQEAPAAPQAQAPNAGQLSVQARIRARREQRRAAALHEAYDHLYEIYVGAGYLRFTPGSTLQRVNEYD